MINFQFRYWLLLPPDNAKPIGGVKQMHRLCEALLLLGRNATLIQDDASFHPLWFNSNVQTISREDWLHVICSSNELDVLILPEIYIHLLHSYPSRLLVIIFNQNGAYSFVPQLKPAHVLKLYRSTSVFHVLCVSGYDYRLLKNGFNLDASKINILSNPIEEDLFRLGTHKRKQIAYMPRKNLSHSSIVTAMLKAQSWWNDWKIVPIHNMNQSEVADTLKSSIAFLSFGHPEGFGLPLAEALACGCCLIGYSGLGGREIFRLGERHGVAVEIPFGDMQGFVDSVYALDRSLKSSSSQILLSLSSCSMALRSRYSHKMFLNSVRIAFEDLETSFPKSLSSTSSVSDL